MNRLTITNSTGRLWPAALLVLGLFAAAAAAAPVPNPEKPKPKAIDVVLCLDVSNSMDGLIASAKMKLWDIVNDLAKIKPTPDLRVALYSYGSTNYAPAAGWVRKESDFTTDLDLISKQLFGLTTRGGTEYAARVTRDALEQQKWSADRDALKLIFVCGNEAAGQDPQVTLKAAADLARGKDVVVNPIFCGHAEARDAHDWKEFAAFAGGRFASIDQDRGTVAVATPMDKKLAELSAELNKTYVLYNVQAGEKALNQSLQDANATRLGLAAAAGRAQSKASGLYRNEDWDLVDKKKADPKLDLGKLPADQLPEKLRKMNAAEREDYVKKMAEQRVQIQKEIVDLSAKRALYVQEEVKKNPSKADKAFDEAIRAAIREQAARKGIKVPD
jgi:hypothetical protein